MPARRFTPFCSRQPDDPIRADLVAATEDDPQGNALDGLRKFAIALVSSKLASIRETAA